jgi:glycine/D-amino acid oxidase-like deaminating enzyme
MDLRTGTSFWQATSVEPHAYPPLACDTRADVVVVGAGVTGALVADRLTAAGADVVVVDRRAVARGSTAATTGLLQYDTDTSLCEIARRHGMAAAVRVYRLGLQAIDAIAGLTRELDGGCGFARRPSVYLASRPADGAALREELRLRRAHGFPVAWLEGPALAARFGVDAAAAIVSDGSAQIDAWRFTHALLRRVVARGARVHDGTTVRAACAEGGGVRITTAAGPAIAARHLVWATGYEGGAPALRRLGRRYSTWVFTSQPVPDAMRRTKRALFWETARPYVYVRTTDDARVIVGGEDRPFHWWHRSPWLMRRKTARLRDRFTHRFPGLSLDVAFRWAGVFTTTADGLPYIGPTPEMPRAWVAYGYGGNGITFSAIAADVIRDAWLGRANADAALFRLDRR